jgi:hypothetical protein
VSSVAGKRGAILSISVPYFGNSNHIISPLTNKTICQITNEKFIQYHIYGYFLTLSHLFPLIAAVFGLMAYRNIRHLTRYKVSLFRHELDKQLTTMVLVQILIYFCTFLPYSIQSVYVLITKIDDPVFDAKMKLVSIITLHFSVLSYAVRILIDEIFMKISFFCHFQSPFYIYICVSKYFRQQLKYVLCYMNFERLQSIQIAVDEEATRQQLRYDDEY